jgi:hypothetical protein
MVHSDNLVRVQLRGTPGLYYSDARCDVGAWSGTHTSVTGSVSSVMFRQTDLEMVTTVQTVQSPS